jgi:diphthamide synthase (EF-2-diphthine--ammonia ligase)
MRRALEEYRKAGVSTVIFGDIFLQDVRRYREERLLRGQKGIFPLWKQDTTDLAQRFLALGFRAILCCVDTTVLDRAFAGRNYDRELLAQLPPGVDPCGENGEFHSFVFDGPILAKPVECRTGERILQDERFCYCDLLPSDPHSRIAERFNSLPRI